jgi:hypothetical protein
MGLTHADRNGFDEYSESREGCMSSQKIITVRNGLFFLAVASTLILTIMVYLRGVSKAAREPRAEVSNSLESQEKLDKELLARTIRLREKTRDPKKQGELERTTKVLEEDLKAIKEQQKSH